MCMASCEFLDGVELSPVLDVEEINKTLYRYIPALEEALVNVYNNVINDPYQFSWASLFYRNFGSSANI